MKKLWAYIVGCVIGLAIIIWMLVLIFVNNYDGISEDNNITATDTQNMTSANENNRNVNNNVSSNNINSNNVNSSNINSNMVNSDNNNNYRDMSYYLHYENDKIVIYREPDRQFYDYADIEMDVLPPEIKEQIKLGMHIDGEERLYDFLQTYSS